MPVPTPDGNLLGTGATKALGEARLRPTRAVNTPPYPHSPEQPQLSLESTMG